jgi:hypothetical protein
VEKFKVSKIIDFPTATGGSEKKPASTLPQDGRNEDSIRALGIRLLNAKCGVA